MVHPLQVESKSDSKGDDESYEEVASEERDEDVELDTEGIEKLEKQVIQNRIQKQVRNKQ